MQGTGCIMASMMDKKPHKRTKWTPAAIRALREEFGLSVEQAAAKLNITPRQWYHWEVGTRNPGGPALLLLDLLEKRKF